MNDLKYVIVIPPGMTLLGARAIIFNGMITHSSVVPESFKVHSAGFCVLGTNNKNELHAKCYGESSSLGVKSDPIFDAQTVRKTLTRNHSYLIK